MDDDGVLQIDHFPHLRKVLWASLIRTAIKYIGIGVMGGLAMGALVYYSQNGRNAFLPIASGILMVLTTIPAIVHWSRHFWALLQQVSALEQRVRAGEVIRATEIRFYSYRRPRV